MAISRLLHTTPGYRLIDGTLINQIEDNINTLTANGVARTVGSQTLALPVTAVANTDFTMTIPSGSLIESMTVYTTTAYTAVTDAKLEVGSTVGGVDYVAATTIKAIGVAPMTLVAAAAAAFANFTAGTLFVRVVQSGGSTAVGAATLVVVYSVPTT